MRKNTLFSVMLVVATFLSAACTPGTAGTADTSGKAVNQTAQENKNDLVIGFNGDAVTMLANTDVNSFTDFQIRNIYDPLIDRDEQGKLIPALATEWKQMNDLTWEITLRDDVTFHNGEPFNAEAVKFNIDYILDEKNNSFYRSRWTNIQEAKVMDKNKLQIITKQPFPDLGWRLSEDLLIMEPTHIKKVGLKAAAENPVGTGAYKFDKWERHQYLKLVANEKYWKGKPSINQVTFKYIPEFSGRLAAFLSGEVDLIGNVPVESIDAIKKDTKSKIESVSTINIVYVALNTFYDGPLKDKKVRQAINYAVDVDELLNSINGGYGTKMTGPLSKGNQDYTETTGYGYDLNKAIALLAEAGYKPSDLNLQLDVSETSDPIGLSVTQAIASQLDRIGVKVSIQNNEWGNHLAKIRQREMKDMYYLGYTNLFTAQNTLESLFVKDAPYSSFYNPEVEEMINKAISTTDQAARKKSYDEIQHRLVEEAAWVPLWQREATYALAKELKFKPRIDSRLYAFDMSW